MPGSVTMRNVSGRKCALTGYLIVKFRDADGDAMAVTLTHRPDPQTPHTIAIPAGETGIAGLDWQRYENGSPCRRVPKTLSIWLPPTVQNPHPERGPSAKVNWISGDSAGLCGKVELSPVNFIP